MRQKLTKIHPHTVSFRLSLKPQVKALSHLSQELTRKLAASIFIQSQCLKVYFNKMQELAASLQAGFAIRGKEPYILYLCSAVSSRVLLA